MNKKAFTLLEVIIVIIIVGVLAALGLPRMYRMIEYSRSAEALNIMMQLRRSFEHCHGLSGSAVYNCDISQSFLTPDLNMPNSHFTYSIDIASDGTSYTLCATRNTLDGGDNTSQICFVQVLDEVLEKFGTGVFAGFQ